MAKFRREAFCLETARTPKLRSYYTDVNLIQEKCAVTPNKRRGRKTLRRNCSNRTNCVYCVFGVPTSESLVS